MYTGSHEKGDMMNRTESELSAFRQGYDAAMDGVPSTEAIVQFQTRVFEGMPTIPTLPEMLNDMIAGIVDQYTSPFQSTE